MVHDELDLPPGVGEAEVRRRHQRSQRTQGYLPILGSKDFWRLRLGIGHPGDKASEQESSTTCCIRRGRRAAAHR